MEKSEQINELALALAKAQAEMGNAKKSSNNPFFKSKYADLAEVLDTCREALSKNNLSVVQPVGEIKISHVDYTGTKDGEITTLTREIVQIEVNTMLMHSSGQWISSTMTVPVVKYDPQAAGSAITYARRYSLAAMVGIAQADDDAEGAMNRPSEVKNEGYTRNENGTWYLKSKNNGKWADAKVVPLERLNDMANDKDYAPAHNFIREVMAEKSKQQ